jgi:hypothetical protein
MLRSGAGTPVPGRPTLNPEALAQLRAELTAGVADANARAAFAPSIMHGAIPDESVKWA